MCRCRYMSSGSSDSVHGCADNLKLTFPIAAAVFQMAWGVASLPSSGAGVNQQIFTEMRWATDYLLACFGNTTLVTQANLSAVFLVACNAYKQAKTEF